MSSFAFVCITQGYFVFIEGQTGSKKATSTAKGAQKDGKKKPAVHPNDKLTPNLAIEIAKKDLMFEEK